MEATISSVARELGVLGGIGPLKWPPVDFTFEPDALNLVRSPRDRIQRLPDALLVPDLSLLDQQALEERIEADDPTLSALVIRIGGVGTYPAQVSPQDSLHRTLFSASHEWMHHWLFFRPLGRKVWAGGELSSINETVADIFGEEVGDLALTRLTDEVFDRPPFEPPVLRPPRRLPDDIFDYTREMRFTRVRLEELLGQGQVDEAEAFLEEQRLGFVANGFNIRKLNNAWFAFHGTYAGSAESISPIEGQLRAIRADTGSVAAFLDHVSSISRPGELEAMAREAGWEPTPPGRGDG